MNRFIWLLFTYMYTVNAANSQIRYVPLGDSYTICEGATIEQSWPVILTRNLNAVGIEIELVTNPARTGYTTQNLIESELPIFKSSSTTFTTLLIGVNDWVQGVTATVFTQRLVFILDEIQKSLPTNCKIIVINIPDFSVTPQGKNYGGGRDITKGIKEFNTIIKKEATKRGLPYVDVFMSSLQMKNDVSLISSDGLHPSAKEYANWEKLIFPVAKELLGK